VDERTRFFLWLLLAGGYFALLGGVFGAVTGYATWRDGRAAGTVIGLSVARAVSRLADEPLSRTAQSILVGGVDGAFFGLLSGLLIGAVTGWRGGDWRLLGPVMLAGLLLVGGAVLLGVMAHVIGGGGRRAVLGLFVGGMLGASGGYSFAHADGLFAGVLLGAAAGVILARAIR
jgi:hypothetical protein